MKLWQILNFLNAWYGFPSYTHTHCSKSIDFPFNLIENMNFSHDVWIWNQKKNCFWSTKKEEKKNCQVFFTTNALLNWLFASRLGEKKKKSCMISMLCVFRVSARNVCDLYVLFFFWNWSFSVAEKYTR